MLRDSLTSTRVSQERRRRECVLLPVVVAIVAVLAIPAGWAAPTSITYTPPFHGLKVERIVQHDVAGCAGSHFASSPLHFNRSTDMMTWQGSLWVPYCPVPSSPGSYVGGTLAGEVSAWIPLRTFPGPATATSIAVTWNMTAFGNISHHMGTCPNVTLDKTGTGSVDCELEAYAGYSSSADLLDLTNGTTFGSSKYSPHPDMSIYFVRQNFTSCFQFSCQAYRSGYSYGGSHFNGSTSSTWWINATLNHSHNYSLFVDVSAFALVILMGYGPGSRAAAATDLATAGRGAQLVSVVES